jgi:hypothetical protein
LRIGGETGRIKHNPVYSAGGIDTVASDANTDIIATVSGGGEERVFACAGKNAAWVRGSNSFAIPKNAQYPEMFSRSDFMYPESLMRICLSRFGYALGINKVRGTSWTR